MRAPSRFIAFCLIALVAGGGLLWWASTPPTPAPTSATIPVAPAAAFLNADASAAYYETQIRRHPEDIDAYVALAQVYLQQAAETGREADFVPRAEATIASALERTPSHYVARVMQARLYNTLHQFEAARDLARTLLAENEKHAYVYGILVDALVELGEYDAAVIVCDQMLALKPSLAAYARASYLRELHGDGEGAIEAMQLAANAGVTGSHDRAWALYNLANLYLGQNDADTAAYLFQGILDERPDFALALGGLGHIAHLRGDVATATRHLQAAHAQQPRDEFLERLLEIRAEAGETQEADHLVDALYDGYLAAAAMGENVDMEIADFLADQDQDLERALDLAIQNYSRRPNHLHTLETYAWTLFKNNRPDEAIPYIERAQRFDTGDAMVDYRAGLIYRAAGNSSASRMALERALANHLHIESPTSAAHAQALLRTTS